MLSFLKACLRKATTDERPEGRPQAKTGAAEESTSAL